MEKLTINNFLIFEYVDMEIRKFNILIGEQASGKSLLAKLVYFFRSISTLTISNLKKEKRIDDLPEDLNKKFIEYFPKMYWRNNVDFNIIYETSELVFEIKYTYSDESQLNFEFSENFVVFYNDVLFNVKEVKKGLEKEIIDKDDISLFNYDRKVDIFIVSSISKSPYSSFFNKIVYIPSSRSFFSTLSKNIWTLNDSKAIDIDPFMSNFGKEFEQSKLVYEIFEGSKSNFLNDKMPDNYLKYDYFKNILKGKFEEEDNKSWIIGDNYKVNLSRASSGQQEVLPLLMVLTTTSLLRNNRGEMYFIEEPEAHLFPEAQNNIISLISLFFSEHSSNFFITTHSPYILSAINNAILADDIISKGKLSVEGFVEISKGAYPIPFKDVSAYAVTNGKIESIKDEEYKMIGSDIIDSASDLFQDIMNKLLMLDNE